MKNIHLIAFLGTIWIFIIAFAAYLQINSHQKKIDNYEKMIDLIKRRNFNDSVRLHLEKQINEIKSR